MFTLAELKEIDLFFRRWRSAVKRLDNIKNKISYTSYLLIHWPLEKRLVDFFKKIIEISEKDQENIFCAPYFSRLSNKIYDDNEVMK